MFFEISHQCPGSRPGLSSAGPSGLEFTGLAIRGSNSLIALLIIACEHGPAKPAEPVSELHGVAEGRIEPA